MEIHGCYACGKPIPRLKFEPDGGFTFECTRCGAATKPSADIDQARMDWNEGRTYTGETFWKMIFGKEKHT